MAQARVTVWRTTLANSWALASLALLVADLDLMRSMVPAVIQDWDCFCLPGGAMASSRVLAKILWNASMSDALTLHGHLGGTA